MRAIPPPPSVVEHGKHSLAALCPQWTLAMGVLVGLVTVAVVPWPQAMAATRALEDARPLLIAVALGVQGLAVVAAVATYLPGGRPCQRRRTGQAHGHGSHQRDRID